MKKILIVALAAVFCAAFTFAGCSASNGSSASQSAAASQSAQDDQILAVKGEITEITVNGDTTSVTVSNGSEDAAYQTLVLNITDDTPIEINGKTDDYDDGMLKIGDSVEAYLSSNSPVTASEPPIATPNRVVVISQGAASSAAVQTEYEGTITEITKDGENVILYVQEDETADPADDVNAVVSGETIIVSEASGSNLTADDLQVGQKITVTTNGVATFSIPPQVNAQSIAIHDAQTK